MVEKKMTKEEFEQWVKGKSDEELLADVKGQEDAFLDGIFDAMKMSFDPVVASGQKAVIQYDVNTPVGVKSYQLKVENDSCTVMKEGLEKARVTLVMKLTDFLRMMARELNGMQAYMTGKLKVSGDMMFSQNLSRWFK